MPWWDKCSANLNIMILMFDQKAIIIDDDGQGGVDWTLIILRYVLLKSYLYYTSIAGNLIPIFYLLYRYIIILKENIFLITSRFFIFNEFKLLITFEFIIIAS